MLNTVFPKAELVLTQLNEDSQPGNRLEFHNRGTNKSLGFQMHSFNIEKDLWPFNDDSFDLILCMEIIEHLMLDPAHVFREAHRVLRTAGKLVVTTPNIASYESLNRLIQLRSPYCYGVYSMHGAYGRHNREYTPGEVELLGRCSGFDTAALTTRDTYGLTCDYGSVRAQIQADLGSDDLRRQTIFYKGIKANRPFDKYPSELYDFDPGVHRAIITIKSIAEKVAVNEPIIGSVLVTNTGGYVWRTRGDNLTTLCVMLLSGDKKVLSRDFRVIALPEDAAPGKQVEIEFKLAGFDKCGEYFLRFDMVRERVCWFSEVKPVRERVFRFSEEKPNWMDAPLRIYS
jgi:SAM-dependent methyltransferase